MLCAMRATVVLLLLAAACPKKAGVEPAVKNLHPELQCPEETDEAGAPPPDGLEVWCQLPAVGGLGAVRQGPSITFHPNGQKAAMGEWRGGKQDGLWNTWYDDGQPQSEGTFLNGQKQGFWTEYHATGHRMSAGQMIDDVPDGEWTYWNEQGGKAVTGAWVNGERQGEWYDYASDGVAVRVKIYQLGRMISQREL